MAKEMTVDEAVRIIQETYEFGNEFDEAVNFLKTNDPQNSALSAFDSKDLNEVKKARAKAYLQAALAEENYDEQFSDAVQLLKDDKKIQDQVADEQDVFDKENHLDMTDEDAVLRNTQKIGTIADSFLDNKDNADEIAAVKEKIDVVDDSGKSLSDDEAQKYWDSLLESAKQQAIILRAGDVSFFLKKDDEKRQTLDRDIKNFWTIGVASGVAGSAINTPNDKQVNPENKDYDKYVKAQADNAEKALDNLFKNGEKAKIKADYFLHNAVETSRKISSYASRWLQKGFKRAASLFSKRKENFDNKMKGLWGKTYETRKAAVEQIKNNKWRLIADTAATGIVAATAATGVALPVVAGYAVYTAAGSWVWPLIEKKTKAIREAKKNGASTKEWEGFNGLKKAFAQIKSDNKEYKKYKNRAYTGTAFGIAGAGLVAGVGAASGWAVDKAGYLTAKVASSAVRSVGSITSQLLNYKDVKKDFKADPSAENRAKLKQAKWGLGLGATLAMAGNLLSFNHVLAANNSEHTGGVVDKVRSWFSKGEQSSDAAVAPTENSATVAVAESQNADLNAAAVESDGATDIITAPADYDAAMGISEKHWNEMHQKLTGIYENHSAIFGKENVSSAEAWDKMYQNLDNAMKAKPEYFGDMTKEQVLYKYMKLVENTERVTSGPSGYLVTKLGKDGLPTYGDKDLTQVMRAMNAMLNCGDEFKVPVKDMQTAFAYIDDKSGRYMGPGADIGVTGNRYIGGRVECDNDYQNAWKRAARKIAHRARAVPTPIVEDVPEVAPAQPVNVSEEVVNKVADPKPVHISEEVINNPHAPAQKVVIVEGATDGSLDVNNEKVSSKSRSFKMPLSNER